MGYFYILRWVVALSLVTYNAAQVCLTYSNTTKPGKKIDSNALYTNKTSPTYLSDCINICIGSGNPTSCTISFIGQEPTFDTPNECFYYKTGCWGCTTNQDDTSVVIDFWCSTYGCGPLTAPAGGSVNDSNGNTAGSVATYSCDAGYVISGNATTECRPDGIWSNAPPSCTSTINCGAPTSPIGGIVNTSGGTTLGSIAMYSCNAGYVRSGPATTECKPDGAWSNTAPSCTLVDCGTLTDPVNGTVDMASGTLFGKEATFSCDEGFVLNGANKVTCDATGIWSFPMPSCVPAGSMMQPNPRVMVKAWNFTNSANFTVLMTTNDVTNAVRCARMCTRQMADAFVNGGSNACSLVKYESTSGNCTMYYRDNVDGESVNCEDSGECFVFEDQWFTM